MRWSALLVIAMCGVAPAAETVRVPESAPAGDTRAATTLARLASLRVTLDLRDAPAAQAIAELCRLSGVNLVLDGELRAAGRLDDARVTLEVTEIPCRSALALVLDFLDLAACFRHGVLLITTPEKARGALTLLIYDVRDLTAPLAEFPGPRMELPSGGGMESTDGLFNDTTESDAPTTEEIVTVLRDALGDELEAGGASVVQIGGQLVVRQSSEGHRRIAALLAELRACR